MTTATSPAPKPRLGEELPIFCERCGYSLHGLPQNRCAECEILHFHCPECGHRQPINTLRPAVQQVLGRARAWLLALFVFIKLFMMFWLLFAWVGFGVEWTYTWDSNTRASGTRNYIVRPVDLEETLAFLIYGFAYGMFARMLLLRWRRGYLVGLCLAALMLAALTLGVAIERADRDIVIEWPWRLDYVMLVCTTMAIIVLGAAVVWWIWSLLVRVFLPARIATTVLDWQRFRPARSSELARE